MNYKEIIGKQLRTLRLSVDLTQQQLGDIVGVQNSQICKIEAGEGYPSLETLIKLKEYFKVDFNYFFDDNIEEISDEKTLYLISLYQDLTCENQQKILTLTKLVSVGKL